MSFSKRLSDDPERIFPIARAAIEKAGGSITGDIQAGEFSGRTALGPIAGSYRIVDRVLSVTISRKPPFVPESVIRNTFERYFS